MRRRVSVAPMTLRFAHRLTAVVMLALVGVGALAGSASAHGRGSESTNFESRVTAAPEIDGVTWDVYGGDQYLAVINSSDTEVVVEGYQGEPYARIGPDGVFLNLSSEATYVN